MGFPAKPDFDEISLRRGKENLKKPILTPKNHWFCKKRPIKNIFRTNFSSFSPKSDFLEFWARKSHFLADFGQKPAKIEKTKPPGWEKSVL